LLKWASGEERGSAVIVCRKEDVTMASYGPRLFVATLISLGVFLMSCEGISEPEEPATQSPSISVGSAGQTVSEPGIILTYHDDLDIEGLMVYGAGNPCVEIKNIGNSPISTTGIRITLGSQEARGSYLAVLKPGEDARIMYGVQGDKFIIPQGLREVKVMLEILFCKGIVDSLSDIEEEILLKKTVSVIAP